MKLPIILVDGADVSFFASAAEVQSYVESPDIGCYRAFAADGEVLELASSEPAPRRSFGVVRIGSVALREAKPRRTEPEELARILSEYLTLATGRKTEGLALAELVRHAWEFAGRT